MTPLMHCTTYSSTGWFMSSLELNNNHNSKWHRNVKWHFQISKAAILKNITKQEQTVFNCNRLVAYIFKNIIIQGSMLPFFFLLQGAHLSLTWASLEWTQITNQLANIHFPLIFTLIIINGQNCGGEVCQEQKNIQEFLKSINISKFIGHMYVSSWNYFVALRRAAVVTFGLSQHAIIIL